MMVPVCDTKLRMCAIRISLHSFLYCFSLYTVHIFTNWAFFCKEFNFASTTLHKLINLLGRHCIWCPLIHSLIWSNNACFLTYVCQLFEIDWSSNIHINRQYFTIIARQYCKKRQRDCLNNLTQLCSSRPHVHCNSKGKHCDVSPPNLEAARYGLRDVPSLWHLTGVSEAIQPRCQSYFIAIR